VARAAPSARIFEPIQASGLIKISAAFFATKGHRE